MVLMLHLAAMRMKTKILRLSTWFACFAILMAALAPSISHALAATNGSGTSWVEICSTTGIKAVKVVDRTAPGAAVPAETMLHFADCLYCLLHADVPVLPHPVGVALPLNADAPAFPFLFYQSPRPLFLWAAAQSRAPPFAS